MSLRLDAQVAHNQRALILRVVAGPDAAAQDGADARNQLARVEGLGQVIVSTQLQPDNLVDVVVARGEHEDGQVAAGAQLTADLPSIKAGQHQVEHDQVRRPRQQLLQRDLAVGGAVDLEALALQIEPHKVDDVLFVIDEEDRLAHEAMSRRMCNTSRSGRKK